MARQPAADAALDELVRRSGPDDLESPTGFRARELSRGVRLALLGVVLCAALVGWRWLGRAVPIDDRMPRAPAASDAGESASASSGSSDKTADATSPGASSVSQDVVVHVAGAVQQPGVVRLSGESRVVDAVDAAGGLTADADPDRINLAARLLDGSWIAVPALGAPLATAVPTSVAGAASSPDSGEGVAAVDLNSATKEQLESLPGVGPATASAILDHREENGPYGSVDDLLDVSGIGEAKLDALRDLVVVR